MKNITKTGLFMAGFFTLILVSVSISAETATDDPNDVWVQELGTSGMTYQQYKGNRDNVDVTSVSYEISDSTVTATLTVAGQIINDAYHTYMIYLENPSGQYYASYSAGSGLYMGTDGYGGEWGQLNDPISGDTFTAIFEISHPEDNFDLYGFASESVDATEAYYDYAPDMFAPYYEASTDDNEPVDETDSGDTDNTEDTDTTDSTDQTTDETTEITDNPDSTTDTDNGTPGFEFLAIIAAFAAIIFIVKRRH
jgi:hypothetical protein